MRLPRKYRIKTPTTSPPSNKPQYHNYYTLDHKLLSNLQRYLSSNMPLLTTTTTETAQQNTANTAGEFQQFCSLTERTTGGKEGCSITILFFFFTTERLVHLMTNQLLTNFKFIQCVSKKTVKT